MSHDTFSCHKFVLIKYAEGMFINVKIKKYVFNSDRFGFCCIASQTRRSRRKMKRITDG